MPEENKDLIRRVWDEIFNKGNLDAIDENFAPDAVFPAAPPGVSPNPEGFKQTVSLYRAAFPDLRVVFVDQVANGDKVASRVAMSGTHQGELAGLAATGKEIAIDGINIIEVSGGKIVAVWGVSDQLRMMRQIGAIPS
jgi:predicted ester cyclase